MKQTLKRLFYCLLVLLTSIALSCLKNDSATSPEDDPGDVDPPSLFIEGPSSNDAIVTTSNSLTLSGTAEDDTGLEEISWVNDRGGSGVATGLTNWSVADVPLAIGDNSIVVTAKDLSGKTGQDEIVVTYNEFLQFSGQPFISPGGTFVNTATPITIRIAIEPNPNLVAGSVRLIEVDNNNNEVAELGELFDDGLLQHADDILGDGVFSTILDLTETSTGEIRMRIAAKTQENSGEVEGYSSVFTFNVFDRISSDEDEMIEAAMDSALNRMEAVFEAPDSDLDAALTSTVNLLLEQPGVEDAYLHGNQMIKVDFSSGLSSGILLSELDQQGRIITQGGPKISAETRMKLQKRKPLSQQTIGINSLAKRYEEIDEDIILNQKILIYEPFANLFWPADKGDAAKAIIQESDLPFEVVQLKNQAATVDALFSLTEYGFIIIDTHGFRGEEFLTGEYVTENSKVKYERLRREKKLFAVVQAKIDPWLNTFSWGEVPYWGVNNKFIQGLSGTFPRSVIFNSSCESSSYVNSPHSLKTAFFNKGAKTYLGVSDVSTAGFLEECLLDFTGKFNRDLQTTGESFSPGRVDPKNGALYMIRGNEDMHYATELLNGDFETGDLTAWNKDGDGRVIAQLGTLSPLGGSFMGIISTGLGQTTTTGSIEQAFRVEETETTLTINWNFLSEEFLEFIGSNFQDFFRIEIVRKSGEVNEVFFRNVDQIASQFGASQEDPGQLIAVSPGIVFDRGDVFMTGWQTINIDISAYQEEFITLRLSAGDIGDSIYDTAILLDEFIVQ